MFFSTSTSPQNWLVALFLILNCSVYSQLTVIADRTDAYYSAGQSMNFLISGGGDGTANYVIRYDRGQAPNIAEGTVFVSGGTGNIPFQLNEPGMVFCEVTLNGQKSLGAAAFSPFEIQPYEEDPADFDSFWQGWKNQLAAVPINPVLTPLFPDPNQQTSDFKINLGSIDGRRVYGYLSIPPGAGPFPAIVTMASYGGVPNLCIPRTEIAIETGAISLSIWMHNADPTQAVPSAYLPQIDNDPNQNYYRYGPLAIMRAMDYIETMPEYDGQNMGLAGNSEGAGMSLLTAGIDSRVKLVTASLFSMSEHTGLKYGRASGFPFFLFRNSYTSPPQIDEAIVSATKYFDVLRSAKRFDGPVFGLTGYLDETIMPATNFAAFNQLKGSTVLIHNIKGSHTSISEFIIGKFDFIRKHFNIAGGNTGYFADAGTDILNAGSVASLSGKIEINDVENFTLAVEWEKVSGPGDVIFSNKNARNSTATFTQSGDYLLRFRATDNSSLSQNAFYHTISDHIKITANGLANPCEFSGGDADNDGICANVDCDDNNPNISSPGDACNDADPNTINDQIQPNCTCAGVPNPCMNNGGDADGDSVCANVDCNDNNPNISFPGDACDDGDIATIDDEIQSDCSCAGVSNTCNVTWTISGLNFNLNNFNAPFRIFKILDNNFSAIYECNDWTSNTCGFNESFTFPNPGNYWLQIQTSSDFSTQVCNIFEQITINAAPCQNNGGDADGDGICADIDCNDNDSNLTLPGNPCDDGDASTENDLIQNDCSCLGSSIGNPCLFFGGDNDDDGVCADQDCNDNDPNISTAGDACNDGNPGTFNDEIQADCSCLGTPIPCFDEGGDVDDDGFCANVDCNDFDPNINQPGDPCDDGDPDTENDVMNAFCECEGEEPFCNAFGGDNDNDGVCANVDCDDFNPNIGAEGDACDDENPSTINDLIQFDCSCIGTSPCANNGGDADNDGICADMDCDDSNPNLTLPGNPCDDGNPETTDDEIQADCSCLGISTGCNVTWTLTGLTINLQNFNAPFKIFKVLNNNFSTIYECNDWGGNSCSVNESFTVPNAGLYWIQIQTTLDFTTQICNIFEQVNIVDNPCINNGGDADSDGICANVDCDDNDASIGKSGDSCDDGDVNTINDLLQNDCTCLGTFDACAANGGDADNDGTCANADCDDNNPFISNPGDACDDANPSTENDVIQANCSCVGTPIPDCQNNVTDGGMISGDETICPDDDPSPIMNLTFPAGGIGTVEYLWLQSTVGCPMNLSDSIPGAHQSNFDPSPIAQTTFYRRLSRKKNCIDWFEGESNCITKTVDNTGCDPNACNVSWSLVGNDLVVSGLTFPINAVQLADANFNPIYVCNDWTNPCGTTETIPILSGLHYLSVQTFLDWSTEVCHIFEAINVPVTTARTNIEQTDLVANRFSKTKIANSFSQKEVTIFPNPTDGILNISLQNFQDKKVEIRLLNLLGKQINILPNRITGAQFQVNLDGISSGIYIIQILPEGEKPISKKLRISK